VDTQLYRAYMSNCVTWYGPILFVMYMTNFTISTRLNLLAYIYFLF